MNDEQLKLLIEADQRSKNNETKLETLTKELKDINKLASSIETLAVEIKHMRQDQEKLAKLHAEEVKELDNRLTGIEKKPGDDFEKIKWLVITRYSIGCTGFFIRQNRTVKEGKHGSKREIFNIETIRHSVYGCVRHVAINILWCCGRQ